MEKMTKEYAKERLFEQKLDCAQTVFSHFAEELDLDEEEALRIASGFGGGMHHGGACGCVTGGLMTLGLKYGFTDGTDEVGKNLMNEKSQKYLARFRERCGALNCRELLGVDVGTDEGKMKAGEVIPLRCPGFVEAACDILDEMLSD